jgi:branched-chain amino acid transport system substrate-binding protein
MPTSRSARRFRRPASLGIPYRNTLGLLPKEVAGQKIEWVILDDGSDPTNAVKNARKLTSEDNVDIILGANTSPIALALVDVASETKTPFVAMASSIRIVSPMDDKRYWVFKASQADALMVGAIVDHMKASNVKRAAFIGANVRKLLG